VQQPLPEDSLKMLVKLKLHTTYRDHGWNALHYACASRRVGERLGRFTALLIS
jgi:hypothetical protein